jgi:hypothetical protein
MIQQRPSAGPALPRAFLFAGLALAGCASSPGSLAYEEGVRVLARNAGAQASPAAIAESVNAVGPDFVLLRAAADSAWFAELADRTGLAMSGPAIEQGLGFAYLAAIEPLGDTTIAIPVGAGEVVVLHDALYELGEDVFLDLISFRADLTSDPHALVQAFLEYVATDVMTTAPLVIGVEAADPALADSIAVLLRPSFTPPTACGTGGEASGSGRLGGFRVFVGTPAQIRCEEVSHPAGDANALLARLVLRR